MKSRKQIEGHDPYYFSTCPYCIIVRLALLWMGLRIPLHDIIFHPENKSELISGGGTGQVPCLRIENESGDVRWMYEAIDIICYLREKLAV